MYVIRKKRGNRQIFSGSLLLAYKQQTLLIYSLNRFTTLWRFSAILANVSAADEISSMDACCSSADAATFCAWASDSRVACSA